MSETPTIIELAKQCRKIYDRACLDLGKELAGLSILDLVADNINNATLDDLKTALVVAKLRY